MCENAIIAKLLVIKFVPDAYMTQKMCEKAADKCTGYPLMLKYCPIIRVKLNKCMKKLFLTHLTG